MSRLPYAAALSVALVAGVIGVPVASGSAPPCAKSVRNLPLRLPAPIEITTPCAVYTVFSRGRVTVARRPRLPHGITWMQIAGPNATVVQRGPRLAVLRDRREVWRSAGRFRAAGVFATLGRGAVAFSYEDYRRGRASERLYVARLGARERAVATEERPLGWTRDGRLLTWRFRHGSFGLYLRSADGSLRARIGARLRELRFQPANRTLLALTRSGMLERYHGRWQRLADLRALGFGRRVSFEPLADGLVGVLEGTDVAVLRRDGSLFASARFRPRRQPFSVAGQSGLVASTTGTAVAFAVTSGNRGNGGSGREAVYVLRAGDRKARELYSGRLQFAICERWTSLAWHGDWLLYAATEGTTVALNSRPPTRRIDLTKLISQLAPTDTEGKTDAQLQWAGRRQP